jgi:sulfite reductase alpha subunit-like flavoprotein
MNTFQTLLVLTAACMQAFCEERRVRQQQGQVLGPAVLLFGCRSPSADYLLRDELATYEQEGVLSGVLTAFSRTWGLDKTYVQVGLGFRV